jgi:hypothetical protein
MEDSLQRWSMDNEAASEKRFKEFKINMLKTLKS